MFYRDVSAFTAKGMGKVFLYTDFKPQAVGKVIFKPKGVDPKASPSAAHARIRDEGYGESLLAADIKQKSMGKVVLRPKSIGLLVSAFEAKCVGRAPSKPKRMGKAFFELHCMVLWGL